MGRTPSFFSSSSSRRWREIACAAGLACLLPTCEDAEPFRISVADAERYGVGICSARLDCCDEPSAQDCVEVHARKLLALNRQDITIDEMCLSSLLDFSETLGCKTIAEKLPICVLATGTGVPGDACDFWGGHGYYAHNCSPRNICLSPTRRCIENFTIVGLGGLVGDRCDEYLRCEVGHYCDATGRCAEMSAEGEPCTDKIGCESSLFCSGLDAGTSGICRAAGGLGDPCDEQDSRTCERKQNENRVFVQLECVEGRCREPGPYVCEDVG